MFGNKRWRFSCSQESYQATNFFKKPQSQQQLVNQPEKHFQINYFKYSCEWVTDKGLHHLGEGLKRLTSLQNLNIDFNKYCDSLLEYFYANFSCEHVTVQGLESLKTGLKGLKTLKSLDLDFTG